jgi:hypothetical protein
MSAIARVKTNVFGLHPLTTAIRNTGEGLSEVVELDAEDLWRLDGDNRWRMIVCVRGEIWITQERDVRDYVLTAGEMFIVTQRGSVLIEALGGASVEITPSLKNAPYRGDYPVFH